MNVFGVYAPRVCLGSSFPMRDYISTFIVMMLGIKLRKGARWSKKEIVIAIFGLETATVRRWSLLMPSFVKTESTSTHMMQRHWFTYCEGWVLRR